MESLNFEINSVNIWKINKGRENESLGKCKLKMKKKELNFKLRKIFI